MKGLSLCSSDHTFLHILYGIIERRCTMNEQELLKFILSDIYQNSGIKKAALAQVHAAINLLVSCNVSFAMEFEQGITSTPPTITLTIYVAPTISVSIAYELAEGGIV